METKLIDGREADGKIKVQPNTDLAFNCFKVPQTTWAIYQSEYPMCNSAEMD